jgi:hypothetical protein
MRATRLSSDRAPLDALAPGADLVALVDGPDVVVVAQRSGDEGGRTVDLDPAG